MPFGTDSVGDGEAILVASPASVPIVLGSAGLIGRPSVRNHEDDQPLDWDEDGNQLAPEPYRTTSVPSPCLRLLTVPNRGDGTHQCDPYCPGRQRNGGCLCDIVQDARARGVGYTFEVDGEGYWNYLEG